MALKKISFMFSKIKEIIVIRLFSVLEKYRTKQLFLAKQSIAFKSVGENFNIGDDYRIGGEKHMEIGSNFRALQRLRLEAIEEFNGQKFSPKIKIGNNVTINNDVHIGCTNHVELGDNCLLASRIYISDHNHGNFSREMLEIEPNKRPLVSKGSVIIKNNVWIGEGVAILPNVTIGENAIIGANSVVTKDVPPNSLAAGVPAKVIKKLDD